MKIQANSPAQLQDRSAGEDGRGENAMTSDETDRARNKSEEGLVSIYLQRNG